MIDNKNKKIVLVTGGTRGIGAAIVEKFTRSNYIVYATATTEKNADTITKMIGKMNGEGQGLVLNLGQDNLSKFVEEFLNKFSAPSIFINNAGITKDNLSIRMKEDEWNDVLNINLSACFKLSKSLIRPMLKARWGRLIFITSVVGLSGNPGQTNYSASKAGLGGFSRSLAREVANRGITVNCVAPGFIETDMTNNLPDDVKNKLATQIPIGKFGKPSDVADAVGFLASNEASYITGDTLNVNGGMFMY